MVLAFTISVTPFAAVLLSEKRSLWGSKRKSYVILVNDEHIIELLRSTSTLIGPKGDDSLVDQTVEEISQLWE